MKYAFIAIAVLFCAGLIRFTCHRAIVVFRFTDIIGIGVIGLLALFIGYRLLRSHNGRE